jgi:hypothetical protein
LEPPTSSPASECVPPPGNQRGGHIRRKVRGRKGPNSDDWRKSLVLCLLCGLYFFHSMHIAQLFLKLWIICICELHAKHIKNAKQKSYFIPAVFRRVSKSTAADIIRICLCRWHRVPTPTPLPLREERQQGNYPPPPHWDRRAIQPNLIKFRACSALAPM